MTAPAPLVDPDVDLRIFRRIEMPIELLNEPEFVDLASDAARWAQMRLFFEGWRGEPAGSISANRLIQAGLAGFGRDVAAWSAVADEVLAHWTLCSDGRFYCRAMVPAIEDCWARVDKRRSTDRSRKQRAMLVEELRGVGVIISVEDWHSEVMRRLRGLMMDRGHAQARRARRREILIQCASDCGLLPKAGGTVDVRLATQFRPAMRSTGSA